MIPPKGRQGRGLGGVGLLYIYHPEMRLEIDGFFDFSFCSAMFKGDMHRKDCHMFWLLSNELYVPHQYLRSFFVEALGKYIIISYLFFSYCRILTSICNSSTSFSYTP